MRRVQVSLGQHPGGIKLFLAVKINRGLLHYRLLGFQARFLVIDRRFLLARVDFQDGRACLNPLAGIHKDLGDIAFHQRLERGGIA